jgi:OmpA-OmpF porin, OOP family
MIRLLKKGVSMKLNIKLYPLTALVAFSLLTSCSSRSAGDYDAHTNASPKIQNAETALVESRRDQVNVFAPDSYKKAMKALEEAKNERSDDANNENILKAVQKTENLTAEANRKALITKATLPGVAEARQAALSAHVETHAEKDFAKTEKELAKFAKDIEKGRIDKSKEATQSLKAQYKALQTQSTLAWKLGRSKDLIDRANGEGAEENAPISRLAATNSLQKATAVIEKNSNDMVAINAAALDTQSQAEKLLRVTREAKAAGGSRAEVIILKGEEQRGVISQQQQDLRSSQGETAAAQSQVQGLAGMKNLQNKVETVSEKFNADEADVYQQGQSVIIRLKGMQFPNNKAEIPSSGFATLKKVQEAILAFDSPSVKIEGHTDSSGGNAINIPLSQRRAESVKNYLSANLGMESLDLEVSGHGSDKPLGSNATAEGRAQNRRIDVVIEEM